MSRRPLPRVLVLMATYNGEQYVAEQIDTILCQAGVEAHLWICDDGSSDSTPDICKRYSCEFENVAFHQNENNQGVARNFYNMIVETSELDFDYYAFSDQDDFWLPDKLARGIAGIEDTPETPSLYYSDVYNVDANLENPRPENIAFAGYYAANLKTLLVSNCACGCTMVFNSALATLVAQYDPGDFPRIHDSWVHLIALTCGRVVPDLESSSILRRVSGNNLVGERVRGRFPVDRVKRMLRNATTAPSRDFTKSASLLLEGYGAYMNQTTKRAIEEFCLTRSSFPIRAKLAFSRQYALPFATETCVMCAKLLLGKV